MLEGTRATLAIFKQSSKPPIWAVTSKTVQNKHFDCMLSVLRDCILEDVNMADNLTIKGNTATHCQLVLVLHWQPEWSPRAFFKFTQLPNATTYTVTSAVLEKLKTILPEGQRGKLNAQVYDGAAVMRGATGGMQRKVHNIYRSAHYVHCYAYQLNLIMPQATSHIRGKL